MACGDKYKFLAVTGSGNSFDNPYDDLATLADFEEWVGLAERIEKIANDHLKQIAYIECIRAGGEDCGTSDATSPSWTKYNELIPLQNQVRGQVEQVTSFFSTIENFSYHEPIQEAMEAVSGGLCLIEQANDAIAAYGFKPPILPGVKTPQHANESWFNVPWWVWASLGLGGAIIIGAVVYGATGRRRNPEGEEALPRGRRSRALAGEAA